MKNDAPKYRCRECGCDEFITGLTSYDVYAAVGDKLEFVKQEFTNDDDDDRLYCHECSAEITNPPIT